MRAVSIAEVAPVRMAMLIDCGGTLLRARGAAWPVGALVHIGDRGLLAACVGFAGQDILMAPLSGCEGLHHGMRVRAVSFEDGQIEIPLGRTVDALGKPIDGSITLMPWRLPLSPPLGVAQRARVCTPLPTGIRAIDALLTLGRGQRMAIAAPAGVGKTSLILQVARQAAVDYVVVALVGERGREVADFVRATRAASSTDPAFARDRTIIVAATSDQAPALRLRAADRANMIAEALRATGASVLLVVDSITRLAQAQREIGLALGEPAGIGAYPPSAFALIPRIVERAGGDARSGGAITALYTVLAEGGDADDPIVDAVRAATDGHIVLSRTLAEQGVYPAIDFGASLSRTMGDVVDITNAARARRLWSLATEYRELQLLGGYVHGQDAAIDEALSRQADLRAFIAQPMDVAVPFDEARSALTEMLDR